MDQNTNQEICLNSMTCRAEFTAKDILVKYISFIKTLIPILKASNCLYESIAYSLYIGLHSNNSENELNDCITSQNEQYDLIILYIM